jgi:hypothetical protein
LTATTTETPPNPVSQTPEFASRSAWKAGVLGAVNVLALVLAVRVILLVAVIGAISLALIAIRDPDPWRLGAMGIYALAVVVPIIWLSSRR